MKYHLFVVGLLTTMAVSCTINEIASLEETMSANSAPDVIYATVDDQPGDVDTKTYSDGNYVRWNNDDRISYFSDNAYLVQYAFAGQDGDAGGKFTRIPNDDLVSVVNLGGKIYSVYPYRTDTGIDHDGTISYTIPAVQTYDRVNSFGRGANFMVSKTDDNQLKFKNAGGYLAFDLWGNNVTVSSIILTGNKDESIAGKCAIVMSENGPVVTMDQTATKEVRIDCGEVLLGSSSGNCTRFVMVLPPVNFTNGFTIHVLTPSGGVFSKTTNNQLEIKRNTVETMAALRVNPQTQTLKLNSVSSKAGGYGVSVKNQKTGAIVSNNATIDETKRTVSITLPTVTDFSKLIFDYTFTSGAKLMVGDQEIVSGVTSIDASEPVKIKVCKGYAEKTYTLEAKNTGLPVVRITTPDSYTLSDIEGEEDHVDWFGGSLIRIENANGTTDLDDTQMSIKGRGNVTWQYPKKPYALKFDAKTSLLKMKKDKRWILLANWRDRTLLRNDAAFWLSKRSGLEYTINGQFVELEVDGIHRGNYYLCEQIKISDNRVKITEMKPNYTDKTGGFLMEIDSYYDELRKFLSSEFGLKYMFKDPDVDFDSDTTYNGAYAWMTKYINDFERVLKTESSVRDSLYKNYLDDESAIWFMLINELTENRDFFQPSHTGTLNGPNDVYGPHSTYLYKDSDTKGGKLVMGPVWDFDYQTFVPQSSVEQANRTGWRGFDQTGYYYYYLCYNPNFVKKVKGLWGVFKDGDSLKDEFTDYIEKLAAKIHPSQEFDDAMWPYIGDKYRTGALSQQRDNGDYTLSFDDAIKRMTNSFEARVGWMDNKINSLSTTSPVFLPEEE